MRPLLALVGFAVLVASCSPSCSPSPQPPLPSGARISPTAPAPTGAAGSAQPALTASLNAPYLRTELVDVRTNERFTLASFAGKVVIVEGMAVW